MANEKKEDRWLDFVPLLQLVQSGADINPKEHDVGAISQSVVRHGYVEPIVLDERTSRIVAGHGRVETLAALQKQGRPAPGGVRVESGAWLVPVLRGWRSESDEQASGYLLASNRTTELGGWNNDQLQQLLKGLAAADALEGTGYSGDDLDSMIQNTSAEFTPQDIGSGKHTCPRCNFEFD